MAPVRALLKRAVEDWAKGPGKPEPINDAIIDIQNSVGSWTFATACGLNQIYDVQVDDYFDLPLGKRFYEGDIEDEGNIPKITTRPQEIPRDVIQKKNSDALGVMAIDTYGGSANAGHWIFYCKPEYTPDWFLETNIYKHSAPLSDWSRPMLSYHAFGKTEDYLQPWATNAWCQTVALMFGMAWAGDPVAIAAVKDLRVGLQDTYDLEYQRSAWGRKETTVTSWEDDNLVTNALLASELAPQPMDAFKGNWMVTLKFLEYLAAAPHLKLPTEFKEAVTYLASEVHTDRSNYHSLQSLVMLCTYDK